MRWCTSGVCLVSVCDVLEHQTKIDESRWNQLGSLFRFLEMVTGSKGNTNVMLVMGWVVGFVMGFVMTKVVIKGVEE